MNLLWILRLRKCSATSYPISEWFPPLHASNPRYRTWHLDILWTIVQNIEENVNLHLALLFDLIFKSMLKGCQNRNGCRNGCWSKHQNFSEPKYNSCVITSDIGKLSFTNLQNLRFPGKITFVDRGVWPQALIFLRALIWRFVQLFYRICQNVVLILCFCKLCLVDF